MEYVVGIGVIAAILGFFLIVVPMSMVKHTEWGYDSSHPVYITRKYIDKIGWASAEYQLFAPFISWGCLFMLVPSAPEKSIGYYAFMAALFIASLYWFRRCFNGYFFSSANMHDNTIVMVVALVCVLGLYIITALGFALTMFLGMVICIWWGGRLFMYKALNEYHE